MDRRRFLALLPVALGGCAGAETDVEPTDTVASPTATAGTPTPRSPVTDATRTENGAREWLVLGPEGDASPFVTYIVGSPVARPTGVEPHHVVVANQAAARTMTVRVSERAADQPAVDAELSFPADGICQLELAEPARYGVTVTAGGVETAVTISEFDCNEATTGIFVGPDGTAETESTRTMLGCQTASG